MVTKRQQQGRGGGGGDGSGGKEEALVWQWQGESGGVEGRVTAAIRLWRWQRW